MTPDQRLKMYELLQLRFCRIGRICFQLRLKPDGRYFLAAYPSRHYWCRVGCYVVEYLPYQEGGRERLWEICCSLAVRCTALYDRVMEYAEDALEASCI